MALDLGNLLTTLGSEFIRAKFQPAGVSIQPFPGLQQDFMGLSPNLGIPGVDVVRDTVQKGMCWDPNANCGAGKWIKRSRRRRRRLASASDIRDISALMGAFAVKGAQTQALTSWIVTRGGR